jgi:phage shock protein C
MHCTTCGREIAAGSNFCYYCGARQPVAAAAYAPWTGKRLMRSSTDVKIAGVCAGFAEYLDWDVTLVRVLWVILTLMPAPLLPGIIAYAVCWVVMPVAPKPVVAAVASPSEDVAGTTHTPQAI